MKKTYIAPTLVEIVFKVPTLLAASDPNVSFGSGKVDAGDVESRGFDCDDWED